MKLKKRGYTRCVSSFGIHGNYQSLDCRTYTFYWEPGPRFLGERNIIELQHHPNTSRYHHRIGNFLFSIFTAQRKPRPARTYRTFVYRWPFYYQPGISVGGIIMAFGKILYRYPGCHPGTFPAGVSYGAGKTGSYQALLTAQRTGD